MRETLTIYDASYVVLAGGLGATMLTCDGKLWRSHGHDAKSDYISASSSVQLGELPKGN